jgi:hypothetical protein
MAWKDMTKTDHDQKNPNTGSIYHESISLGDTEQSDNVILPVYEIYAIGLIVTGSLEVYFTIDPPQVIKTGSPSWEKWDGVSAVNLAVTGFYVVSTSGAVTAKITVKAAKG